MKEKVIVGIIVALMAALMATVFGGTDAIYVVVSLLFFGLCVAYAEWCQRL